MKIRVNQFYKNVDCPREFVCAHCGAHVYVIDPKDKRVKYCSAACEKQYWRDKSNLDIDNLICVTRNELKVLNKYRLISSVPELTKTGLNIAKIRIKLAELRKEKK